MLERRVVVEARPAGVAVLAARDVAALAERLVLAAAPVVRLVCLVRVLEVGVAVADVGPGGLAGLAGVGGEAARLVEAEVVDIVTGDDVVVGRNVVEMVEVVGVVDGVTAVIVSEPVIAGVVAGGKVVTAVIAGEVVTVIVSEVVTAGVVVAVGVPGLVGLVAVAVAVAPVVGVVVEVALDLTERGGVVLVAERIAGVAGGCIVRQVVELGDDRLGDLDARDAAEEVEGSVAVGVVGRLGVGGGVDRVRDVRGQRVRDEAHGLAQVVFGHVVVAEALHVTGRVRSEVCLSLGFEDQTPHHVQQRRALHRSSKCACPRGPVGLPCKVDSAPDRAIGEAPRVSP